MLSANRKSSFGALVRESAIYGGGMVLVRGIGFLLTPLFTRLFDAAQFGTLDLLQTAALPASLMLSFRMESAALRYYGEEDRSALFSTYLIAQIVVGGAFLVGTWWILVPVFRYWTGFDDAVTTMMAGCSVVVGLLYAHVLTLLRAEREAARASLVIALETVLNVSLAIALVAGLRLQLAGVFASRVLADGVCTAIVLISRRHVYRLCFSWPIFLRMLRFGVPTLPEGLLSFVTAHIGKIILLRYASVADVGVLAVANKIAGPLKLAFQSFRQAWLPYAFSVSKNSDAHEVYAGVLRGYARLSAVIATAIVLFSREMVLVLAGAGYLEARWLVGWVVAAAVIGGLPYIVNIGLLLAEKTIYYTAAVFASAVATVIASATLISEWGLLGAVVAGLLGSFVFAGGVFYFSQRIRPMPYDLTEALFLSGAMIGLSGLGLTEIVDWPLPIRAGILLGVAALVMRGTPARDFVRGLLSRRRR